MPLIKSDGTVEIGQAPETIRGFFISSSSLINAQEAAEVFSSLSKQRQEETVIKAIHELYDYVEDLQVELHGRLPMLYATVRELPEKIPVGLISNGVNKLVTMLAATTKFHHGILIVDEIENGFYFEKMPNIWTLLYKFCKKNGVQLFASTHSQEALNSLLPAMEGHENDFCLLRTKKENGKCTIKHIAGKNLKAAIEQGGEVR
jgi:predicted ATPase